MKNCVDCGETITTEKFCPTCGAPVPPTGAAAPANEPTVVVEVPVTVSEPALADETPARVLLAPPADPSTAAPLAPSGSIAAGRLVSALRSIAPERWLAAVLGGAIAYVGSFVLAMVLVLLTLLSLTNVSVDWSWLVTAPSQLVGLALGGTFVAGTTVATISISAGLLWLPLLLTAAVIVGIALVSRRDERAHPLPTAGARWILSLVAGATLAVLALVFALVLRPAYDATGSPLASSTTPGVEVSGSAASVTLVFGALLVGTLAAYFSRSRTLRRPAPTLEESGRILATARATVPVVVLYVVIVGILVALAVIISGIINSGFSWLLSSPLWLPTLVADGIAVVNFSVVSAGGGLAAFAGSSLHGIGMVSLVGSLPLWASLLAILLNLVLIVLIGTALHLRRTANSLSSAANWVATVGSFAIAGALLSIIGSVALWTHVDTSGLGALLGGLTGSSSLLTGLENSQGTVGPAAWTFLTFALLGAVVELVAVFVAPSVIALVPTGVVTRASQVLERVGVPLTPKTVPVAETAAPVDAALPMTPERRRVVVLVSSIVGGVVVLVILAAIAVSVLNTAVFSPQKQVETYLSDIQSKNARGALALGDVDAATNTRVLLSNRVLAATPAGITSYRILNTTTSGDQASVTAQIDRDGTKSTTSFTLRRGGSTGLFFSNWRLDTVDLGALSIRVPTGVQSLKVNGVSVDVAKAGLTDGMLTLPAFPGSYTVSLGGDRSWLSATPVKKTVGFGRLASSVSVVEFTLAATPALDKEIATQITDLLANCAKSTDLAPAGCPFKYYSYGDTSGVSWTLGAAPTYTLEQSYDGQWKVKATTSGEATISYSYSYFSGSTPTADSYTDNYYIGGDVSFPGGKPLYTYSG
jgi:hypothetical protein